MEHSTANQHKEGMSRRTFLKQMTVLTGVSAALLVACSSPSATETAVPTTAQQPTTAPTTAATGDAAATATIGVTTTGEGTAEATMEATETTVASTGQDATAAIVAAANAFLATLSDTERGSALFDWTDTAQKQRWSNFPDGAFERAGLVWGDMSEEQRTANLAVLQAILSTEGYNRVLAEWQADDALGDGGGGANFGTDYYYTAVIGTPSETDPWQWQWGGHHVTINATIAGSNLALTPSFIGVEPLEYTDANGNTMRPLGDIETDAFALINALDATQQQTAILGATPIDLVLGPGQDGRTIQSEGLPGSEMTAEQQAAFLQLIGHYTGLANDTAAAARRAEVESTLGETYLAWYGATTEGNAAYFRITGPTIVIEYSPQGARGSGAATGSDYHVHGIYRDPTNDYGAKYIQ